MNRRAWWGLALAACTPAPPQGPEPARPADPPLPVATVVVEPLLGDDRRDAARAAQRAGLLSLHATAVDRHHELAPRHDGRGVLIAILDSGIDPAARGLDSTSDGRRKLVDLRDFSGEGAVALAPATVRGDTIWIGPRRLLGGTHVLARAPGAVWGGAVAEVRFGSGASADLNDNGRVGDTLLVVVAGAPGSWTLFADAGLDGSLQNDRPVRDFAVAGEWFGWSAIGTPPVGIAVNLADHGQVPSLALVVDNAAHGTHVAGIAAGRALYGVTGFDGVAPGAQLLGYKIVNNAEGGITTTGAMHRAITAALAEAERREMPLVINVSYGVGTPREGTAIIDSIIDGLLASHPAVVMTAAAANDGPGLSTLGVPASAHRVLSVGATLPLVFQGLAPDPARLDPVASFSSRGGERAGPDLVAPGIGWSEVPRFDAGNEEKSGSSMAAPHAAGLVARLLSGLVAERRTWTRTLIHRALVRTARPVPDAGLLDQGAGVPDLVAAWRWLQGHRRAAEIEVADGDHQRQSGIWRDDVSGREPIRLRLRRLDAPDPLRIRVRVSAEWLRVEGPALRTLTDGGLSVFLAVDPAILAVAGVHQAEVRIDPANDPSSGPLARVPVTLLVPVADAATSPVTAALQAGSTARVVFRADTGRGFAVIASALTEDGVALMALHEPGGKPNRTQPAVPAGPGSVTGVLAVDAREVRRGLYELVFQAPTTRGVAVRGSVVRSPVHLEATGRDDSVAVLVTSLAAAPLDLQLRVGMLGAEVTTRMHGSASLPRDTVLVLPPWTGAAVLDVTMPDEEWSRFTDFGVSIRDRQDRILATMPLNHATGRLRLQLPRTWQGDTLRLRVTPAAALDTPATPWEVTLVVRAMLDQPAAIDRGGTMMAALAPGATRRVSHAVGRWPAVVPAGWSRLMQLVVFDDDDREWTREVAIPTMPGRGP